MESIEYLVVGAGVVGLACAYEISKISNEVLIIDNNSDIGQETSARNSEVIHAGIYYPKDSLKARLCARGKELLYQYCDTYKVNYKRCGKLVVAQSEDEEAKLNEIMRLAKVCDVNDLQLLNSQEVEKIEPSISTYKAILSPSTGIIDSHGLMLSLKGQIQDNAGMLAVKSKLLEAKYIGDYIEAKVLSDNSEIQIKVKNIINCAGLYASEVSQNIHGFGHSTLPTFFYKGCYFTINSKSPFEHLIYPIPEPGGLGIHSINDISGKVRFGPDVEYSTSIDYSIDDNKIEKFQKAIARYWPDIINHELYSDFVGIRPKVLKIEDGINDFNIQHIKKGTTSITNLLGIESPGLTASLAISELIKANILKD